MLLRFNTPSYRQYSRGHCLLAQALHSFTIDLGLEVISLHLHLTGMHSPASCSMWYPYIVSYQVRMLPVLFCSGHILTSLAIDTVAARFRPEVLLQTL